MTPSVPPRFLTSLHYALLAAAFALIIILGSLVPFQSRPREWSDVWASFQWAMTQRITVESRADWIANIALGIPHGFCLLAAFRVDRPGLLRTLALGFGVVVPFALVLAASVEFGQLYLPKRTCSGADVLAQGLGATIGVIGWTCCGNWLTLRIRMAWSDSRITGGPVGHVLIGYLAVIVVVVTFPFDFSISPGDLHQKLVKSTRMIPMMEFSYWLSLKRLLWMVRVSEWAELTLILLPVGVLLANLPGSNWRQSRLLPVLAALVIAIGLEAIQFFVMSRRSSTTDIVMSTLAMVAGTYAGRWARTGNASRWQLLIRGAAFFLGWVLLLACAEWSWFLLKKSIFTNYFARVDWQAMAELRESHPIMGPAGIVMRGMGYLLLGAIAVSWNATISRRILTVSVVSLAMMLAAGLELGRVQLGGLNWRISTLFVAAIGSGIGLEVSRRLLPALPDKA